MRFAISVLAAALLVAASTGCSGDKSAGDQASATAGATTSTATTTTTAATTTTTTRKVATTSGARPAPGPDQSRWAAQVDDACKPWQQRISQLAVPTDAASLELFFSHVLPLLRKEIAAVKAVKPPTKTADARRARLFTTSLERLERSFTQYLAGIRAGDAAKVQTALLAANAAGAAARSYAVSLDITQCGGYSNG